MPVVALRFVDRIAMILSASRRLNPVNRGRKVLAQQSIIRDLSLKSQLKDKNSLTIAATNVICLTKHIRDTMKFVLKYRLSP